MTSSIPYNKDMNNTTAPMPIIDRDALQQAYIDRILDGMDIKDMMALIADQFDENLDKYSIDELIEEVEQYYPDLLEDATL